MDTNAMKIIDNDLKESETLAESLFGSDLALEINVYGHPLKDIVNYALSIVEIFWTEPVNISYKSADNKEWNKITKKDEIGKVIRKFYSKKHWEPSLYFANDGYFIMLDHISSMLIFSKSKGDIKKVKAIFLSQDCNFILRKNDFLVDIIRDESYSQSLCDYAPLESVIPIDVSDALFQRLSVFDEFSKNVTCQNIRQPFNPLYLRVELRYGIWSNDIKTILSLANVSNSTQMIYHGTIAQSKTTNYLISQVKFDNGGYPGGEFLSLQSFIDEVSPLQYCADNFELVVDDSSVFIDENFIFGIYDRGINFIFESIEEKDIFVKALELNEYTFHEYNYGGDIFQNKKLRLMYEIKSALKHPKFTVQQLMRKIKGE